MLDVQDLIYPLQEPFPSSTRASLSGILGILVEEFSSLFSLYISQAFLEVLKSMEKNTQSGIYTQWNSNHPFLIRTFIDISCCCKVVSKVK